MKCEDCDGDGIHKSGLRCWTCKGTGGICDVCGDNPVSGQGDGMCVKCEEEEEER